MIAGHVHSITRFDSICLVRNHCLEWGGLLTTKVVNVVQRLSAITRITQIGMASLHQLVGYATYLVRRKQYNRIVSEFLTCAIHRMVTDALVSNAIAQRT